MIYLLYTTVIISILYVLVSAWRWHKARGEWIPGSISGTYYVMGQTVFVLFLGLLSFTFVFLNLEITDDQSLPFPILSNLGAAFLAGVAFTANIGDEAEKIKTNWWVLLIHRIGAGVGFGLILLGFGTDLGSEEISFISVSFIIVISIIIGCVFKLLKSPGAIWLMEIFAMLFIFGGYYSLVTGDTTIWDSLWDTYFIYPWNLVVEIVNCILDLF
ncbi:MAG: hypothetical protein AAFQ98_04010 [Bacteroidota bacterium]